MSVPTIGSSFSKQATMSLFAGPSLALCPERQDAQLIGLVGIAHLVSHFSQLLLAPLFPWLKDAFDVS